MPIRCLDVNGEDVFSFNFDEENWKRLIIKNKSHKNLSMKCCNARVVLKKSKLGTKFFAHARRGICATAPESAEHLLGKQLIAEAVQEAGWIALTEEAGVSNNGEKWIADVLAVQGKKKIAFEVQWSPQSIEETTIRQEIYKNSGVRALWLMKQLNILISKDLPTFKLRLNSDTRAMDVLIPHTKYSLMFMNSRTKDDDANWQHVIPIKEFIKGTLLGKLKFAPILDIKIPIQISIAAAECWKCKKSTNLIMSIAFQASELFKNHPNFSTDIYHFDSDIGMPLLRKMLPDAALKSHNIGFVKRRYSKTVGASYLSNGCFHCDALQGSFFDHNYYYNQAPAFTSELLLTRELVEMFEESDSVYRWWFGE